MAGLHQFQRAAVAPIFRVPPLLRVGAVGVPPRARGEHAQRHVSRYGCTRSAQTRSAHGLFLVLRRGRTHELRGDDDSRESTFHFPVRPSAIVKDRVENAFGGTGQQGTCYACFSTIRNANVRTTHATRPSMSEDRTTVQLHAHNPGAKGQSPRSL